MVVNLYPYLSTAEDGIQNISNILTDKYDKSRNYW